MLGFGVVVGTAVQGPVTEVRERTFEGTLLLQEMADLRVTGMSRGRTYGDYKA